MQKNGENKMLNNQSRNCLVNTYAKFGEAEKVAQAFGVVDSLQIVKTNGAHRLCEAENFNARKKIQN